MTISHLYEYHFPRQFDPTHLSYRRQLAGSRVMLEHNLVVTVFRNTVPVFSVCECERVEVCLTHIVTCRIQGINRPAAASAPDTFPQRCLYRLRLTEELTAERALRNFIFVFSYPWLQSRSRTNSRHYHRMEPEKMSKGFRKTIQCSDCDISYRLFL